MFIFQAQSSATTLTEPQVRSQLDAIAKGDIRILTKDNAPDYFIYAATRSAQAAIVIADKFWSTISSAYESGDLQLIRAWNYLCVNPLLTDKGKQELANSLVEEMHFSQQAASEMVPRLWSNEIGKPAEVQLTQLGDTGSEKQREKVWAKMNEIGNKETLGAYFRNSVVKSSFTEGAFSTSFNRVTVATVCCQPASVCHP